MISGKNIKLFNPASMYSELSQQRLIIGVQVLTENMVIQFIIRLKITIREARVTLNLR